MSEQNKTKVTTVDAAKELLARRKARAHLLDFTTYTKPDYEINWHHRVVADVLMQWIRGDITRLIICEPPRHGKSEQVSRRLPAYIFGINPDAEIIATAFGDTLASMFNRDVQRIIESDEYQRLFPNTTLNAKNVRSDAEGSYLKNSDIFEIVGYRGRYRSAGVGSGIVGMGADYIIVDDPIKNAQEANSETIRRHLENWYSTTLRTRLAPNGRILVTVTRWNEDDLVGWLLAQCTVGSPNYQPDADKWVVLNLPAILEKVPATDPWYYQKSELDIREYGEALWPSRYSLESLASTKATLLDDWYPIYQQRPQKPSGSLIQRIDFEILESLPLDPGRLLVRYWDRAATKDGGAYTVGVLMGFFPRSQLFIVVNVERHQLATIAREELIRQVTKLDRTNYGYVKTFIEQEPGSSGKDAIIYTQLSLPGYDIEADIVSGDKLTRLRPFASFSKTKGIKLLQGDWNSAYLRELEQLPYGKYKDQGDASSGAFTRLTVGWEEKQTIVYDEQYTISEY